MARQRLNSSATPLGEGVGRQAHHSLPSETTATTPGSRNVYGISSLAPSHSQLGISTIQARAALGSPSFCERFPHWVHLALSCAAAFRPEMRGRTVRIVQRL